MRKAPPVSRTETKVITENKPAARGGKTKKYPTANKVTRPELKFQAPKQEKLGIFKSFTAKEKNKKKQKTKKTS